MKAFWVAVAAIEIGLLAAYAWWAASADYFVKMPASVSGDSVATLIASRVGWLALVFAAFDLSFAAWINGVRLFQVSKSVSPWLSILAGIAVFVVACALLAIFIVFGMPQY